MRSQTELPRGRSGHSRLGALCWEARQMYLQFSSFAFPITTLQRGFNKANFHFHLKGTLPATLGPSYCTSSLFPWLAAEVCAAAYCALPQLLLPLYSDP